MSTSELDKLKPEVKEKWLEALRSGKYEQGAFSLNREGRFCCLGVLCEVAVEQGVEIVVQEDVTEGISRALYDGEGAGLPGSVREWSGFTDVLPSVGYSGNVVGLSSLNDIGMPFTEIADLIEEYL